MEQEGRETVTSKYSAVVFSVPEVQEKKVEKESEDDYEDDFEDDFEPYETSNEDETPPN